mgnify:CR=1 FL=1
MLIYVIELAKKFWDLIARYEYMTGILFLPCMHHILQYLLMLIFAAALLCWTMCGMVDFSTLLLCFTVLWLYGSQHNTTVIPASKQTGTLMFTSLMIHEKFFRDIFFLLFLSYNCKKNMFFLKKVTKFYKGAYHIV